MIVMSYIRRYYPRGYNVKKYSLKTVATVSKCMWCGSTQVQDNDMTNEERESFNKRIHNEQQIQSRTYSNTNRSTLSEANRKDQDTKEQDV